MTLNTTNKNITFQGNPLTINGSEIKVGDKAPEISVTGTDMRDISWADFADKIVVLSVVPSIDTPTCQLQTKRFNKEATTLGSDVAILTVSMDLPFAQKRWCGAEGVSNMTTASDYKHRSFGESFGTLIKEMGLLARAVFVIDKNRIVRHVEYVASISDEPNYDLALKAVATIKG